MDKPLVSVIIPVYNVSAYLRCCLDSVISQTYENLEIILVDDGSTDDSGEICEEYAKKDARINVIHKENGGLSDARNVALNVITGDYITYIDSDDYVTKDYVEYLLNLIKDTDAEVSACQLKKIYAELDELDKKSEYVEILDNISAMEYFLYQKKFTASAPCKMYKSEIFNKLRYPVGYYYEDMAIICDILDSISRIVISNQQKYFYIQRGNSIMGERFNPKKMDRIKIAEDIKVSVSKKYPELKKATEVRCFLATIQTFREVPMKDEYRQYINIIWDEITKYRGAVIKNNKAKIEHRIIAMSTYCGKRCLKMLGNIYTYVSK